MVGNVKLLLDFDGVILKSHKASKYQLDRSAKFVRSKTQLPLNVCKKLNKDNYPKYGHTVTMLNEMSYIFPHAVRANEITLENYNAFVFDCDRIDRLKGLIDKDAYLHGNSFNRLFRICDNRSIEWKIYTNAHTNWVSAFGSFLDLPIDESKIIWPRDLSHLKPKPESYANVENQFGPSDRFVFVDDMVDNLPTGRDRWIPIHWDAWDGSNTLTELICQILPETF